MKCGLHHLFVRRRGETQRTLSRIDSRGALLFVVDACRGRPLVAEFLERARHAALTRFTHETDKVSKFKCRYGLVEDMQWSDETRAARLDAAKKGQCLHDAADRHTVATLSPHRLYGLGRGSIIARVSKNGQYEGLAILRDVKPSDRFVLSGVTVARRRLAFVPVIFSQLLRSDRGKSRTATAGWLVDRSRLCAERACVRRCTRQRRRQTRQNENLDNEHRVIRLLLQQEPEPDRAVLQLGNARDHRVEFHRP